MTRSALQRTTWVLDRCRQLGFASAGVCPALPSEQSEQLKAWLASGAHASMKWMAERVDVRTDIRTMLEGAKSVIMVADLYANRGDTRDIAVGHGRIARYAQGRDYHKIIKKRLHQLCDELASAHPDAAFRAFVDTAPVMERELAARCGIGWQGKHTLTINPTLGSWFLLGGIVTTLELPVPDDQAVSTDHCGTCTRCIDACPTQAITPYRVDANRCISYLSIEHREAIDSAFHEPMGDWIFGCDICQEVCPHNSARMTSSRVEPYPAYESSVHSFDLLEVLGWSENDRREAFTGSSMKRAKLGMMKRNAVIAAGHDLKHHASPALRDRLTSLAADESETDMVRQAARDALGLDRCESSASGEQTRQQTTRHHTPHDRTAEE